MKTNLSRPLISYLTREIEKGDITRALLWANEYRENDPYFVQALYAFAQKSGRLSTIKRELQQQLLEGRLITHIDPPLPEAIKSTSRKLTPPSLKILESRLGDKFFSIKYAKSR